MLIDKKDFLKILFASEMSPGVLRNGGCKMTLQGLLRQTEIQTKKSCKLLKRTEDIKFLFSLFRVVKF